MKLHSTWARLRALIPIESLWERSEASVLPLITRWDVPQRVDLEDGRSFPVAPDLQDVRPRFNGLPDGGHVTARIHALDDLNWGSPSSAEPLLVMCVPMLASLSQLGSVVAFLAFAAMLPVLYALYAVMGTSRMVGALALGAALPLGWGTLLKLLPGASSIGGGSLVWPASLVVAIVAAVALFAPQGQAKATVKQSLIIGVALVVASVLSLFVSRWVPFLPAVVPWLLACSVPLLMAWQDFKARADVLREQDLAYGASENAGLLRTAHIGARQAQADRAARDDSCFVEVGRATGLATAKLDGFAPDEGLPFGLTQADLSTYLFIFGEIGSGKTSGGLRPVAHALLRLNRQPLGALFMDGKGPLPVEFADLPDYTLIQPGLDLGLIEGLMPEEVVEALLAIVSNKSTGDDSFWNASGRSLLLSALVVQHALCALRVDDRPEVAAMAMGASAAWSLQTTRDLLVLAQGAPEEGMEALLALASLHAEANTGSLLDDALVYFVDEIQAMDDKTKSNIFATVQSWLNPIFQHRDLLRWTQLETGYDPSEVLRGKRCGVALPEVRYGQAGKIAASLIKQRVYAGIRRRGERPNWESEGTDETQVLVLIDEAQELIGQPELVLAPIGRSLGVILCFATQTVENLIGRFGGEAQAKGFLASFLSKVCLRSSPMTIRWMAEELGETEVLVTNLAASGINLEATAERLQRSALLDPNHPSAAYYQHVLRDALRDNGSHRKVGGKTGGQHMLNPLPDLVAGTQWVKQALFTPSELEAHLSPPYRALAMVQRAGVKRRDIVDLKPRFPAKPTVKQEDAA